MHILTLKSITLVRLSRRIHIYVYDNASDNIARAKRQLSYVKSGGGLSGIFVRNAYTRRLLK